MWRLDLVGYALFWRAGASRLAAGAFPASHILSSLRTPPPHLPGPGSPGEVGLPSSGVCLCEKGFLGKIHVNSNLVLLAWSKHSLLRVLV